MKASSNIAAKILVALVGCLFFTQIASAEFSISAGNKNRSMKFTVVAGESLVGTANIVNVSDEDLTLRVYAADGTKTTDGNYALKLPSDTQTAAGVWTTFDKSSYPLKPREVREIKFLISVPADIPPGVYSGGIAVEKVREETGASEGTTVKINTRIVTPFFINVPGEKVADATLEAFTNQEFSDNEHIFILELANQGNTAIIAKQTITIDGFGGLYRQKLTGNEINLYQGESTSSRIHWENKPLIGFFTATATVDFYENDIVTGDVRLIGTKEKTLTISVIPWAIVLTILAVLVAIIAYITHRHCQFKKMIHSSKNYAVQPGDTLTGIAKKNNVDWKLLAKINGLKAPYALDEKKNILIPSKK